jgi:tetratricopeptide (TPR) repeat protein
LKSLLVMMVIAGALTARPDAVHIKAAMAAYEDAQKAVHDRQFDQAIALFRKAIEIEPTFIEAYEGSVKLYVDTNRRLEAGSVITRLLEIEPSASRHRLLLGQILLDEKQWNKALAQFAFVLKTDPLNADALLGFAAAAGQAGMADRASDALERGRKQYPLDARFKSPASQPTK